MKQRNAIGQSVARDACENKSGDRVRDKGRLAVQCSATSRRDKSKVAFVRKGLL